MAKRKKSLTRIIESGYFHTGNSGVTLAIKETSPSGEVVQNRDSGYRYRFSATHGAHGAHSNFEFPLGSQHMVEYLIHALMRVKHRMQEVEFHANDPFTISGRRSSDEYAEIVSGMQREPIFKEIVTGPNDTSLYLIGYKFFDDDGNVMCTTMLKKAIERGGCGSGCDTDPEPDPLYGPDDLGKEIIDGRVAGNPLTVFPPKE